MLVLGVAVALVVAGCGSGGGKLGAKALAEQSKALQALAAEGALLAQDAGAGKTTRIFTRVHSADLHKAAAQAAASLKAAKTEPALMPKLRRLQGLAVRIRGDLERLGGAAKNQAPALGRDLQAAAQASKQIGASLE